MRRRRELSCSRSAKKPKSADAKPWYQDMICVLFETPSGFAIFYCCAALIKGPDVLEVLWDNFTKNSNARCVVWLKQFKTFKDKSSAIQQNAGVNEMLCQMIKKWCSPWMKLAVGKPEYKQIIEECLKIPCIHCPAVMELMWGIQNCMRSLVPREKRKLTEADRLPISHGLHKVLSRYDCVVKPEMVNELILQTASALFWCDSVEKEKCAPLCTLRCIIKSVSGINCDDWTLLKVAAAAKAIWWPEEIGSSCVEFSKEEVSVLVRDRHKYELLIDKYGWLGTYNDMISVHDVRTTKKELLKFLVKKAKASEARQVAETVTAVN